MKKLLILMSMIFITSSGFALGPDELIVRQYSKKASSARKVISDQSLMTIFYTGASTQAVVAVGSGTLSTYLPGPSGTIDLNYQLDAAAYNTVGELCDAIDAEDNYSCALADGKSDDVSLIAMNIAAANANDAKAAAGYSVLIDSTTSSAADPATYLNGTGSVLRLGITPESGKRVVLKYCIGNINVIDSLVVWGKLGKYASVSDGVTRNDSTLVYSAVTADDTDKTIGSIYGLDFIEFAKDEHVVIGSLDRDSSQAAANFLECTWDEK